MLKLKTGREGRMHSNPGEKSWGEAPREARAFERGISQDALTERAPAKGSTGH